MATLSVPVKDAHVSQLAEAVAWRMDGIADTATQAIITKVLSGQTTTAAEKNALGVAFCNMHLERAWTDYRADIASRADREASDAAW